MKKTVAESIFVMANQGCTLHNFSPTNQLPNEHPGTSKLSPPSLTNIYTQARGYPQKIPES